MTLMVTMVTIQQPTCAGPCTRRSPHTNSQGAYTAVPSHFRCEEAEVRKATALPRRVQVWSRQELICAVGLPLALELTPSPVHSQAWLTQPMCNPTGIQVSRHPAASLAGGGWQVEAFCALTLPPSGWSWGWNKCIQCLLCSSHFCWSSELGSQENSDWDTLSFLASQNIPKHPFPLPLWCPRHLSLENHFPAAT